MSMAVASLSGSGRRKRYKVGLNHNIICILKKNEPKVLLIIIQGQQTPTELTWEEIFKKWENLCLDTHNYPTSLGQTVRRKSGTCEPCQCYDSAAWRPPGNVLPTFSDHLGGLHILFSSSRERERERWERQEVGWCVSHRSCGLWESEGWLVWPMLSQEEEP